MPIEVNKKWIRDIITNHLAGGRFLPEQFPDNHSLSYLHENDACRRINEALDITLPELPDRAKPFTLIEFVDWLHTQITYL